jgi:DNA adenine methylase
MDFECPVVIPYYGGKYMMSKQLINMLPRHIRYFEPFFGGGSMFFRKKKAEWNVLNDIDNDLINLYLCVVHNFHELTQYIISFLRSRTIYEDSLEIIKRPVVDHPDPKRAAIYFFVVRNAFNNVVPNTFSKDTKWDTGIIEELRESRAKLNNVTIENLHFADLVRRYQPRPDDFFYFDPPYVVADKKSYYRNVFTEELHQELKEICDLIDTSGSKFMISYDNVENIRKLYKNYNLNYIKTKYVGTVPEKRGDIKTELVITNYTTQEQKELFYEYDKDR